MLYVGLDYHLRTSDLCMLNEDGKVVKRQTVKGRWDEVARELAAAGRLLGQPLAVVFEATGGYGPLHGELSKVAGRVVMAHPAALRLIWGSRRKNDRIEVKSRIVCKRGGPTRALDQAANRSRTFLPPAWRARM